MVAKSEFSLHVGVTVAVVPSSYVAVAVYGLEPPSPTHLNPSMSNEVGGISTAKEADIDDPPEADSPVIATSVADPLYLLEFGFVVGPKVVGLL